MVTFRIESRWPAHARWRVVTPRPHDERYAYDAQGLRFDAYADADAAADAMRKSNAGEYRVRKDETP